MYNVKWIELEKLKWVKREIELNSNKLKNEIKS